MLPFADGMVVTGGAVNVAGPVALYLGICAAALGRTAEALDHLAAAHASAERMNARPWAARVQFETGRVLLDRALPGDRQEAERLLRTAARTAEQLGMVGPARGARSLLARAATPQDVFRLDTDVWTLSYRGQVVRLPDAKGLQDIARLLAAPGQDVPAAALLGVEASAEARLGSDPLLDMPARQAYRRRLADLDDEVAEATANADMERAARTRAEREVLVDALSAAYGHVRRVRRLGDSNETRQGRHRPHPRQPRANRPRHAPLGEHLRESIVTGTLCSYRPHEEVHWQL